MITMRSYRLGAEELVELGRAKNVQSAGRRPFFSNRPQMSGGGATTRLGDAVEDVEAFVTSRLVFELNVLSALANVPLDVLAQGVGITMDGVADLLENVPTVGDLFAEILVLGAVALKFSLPVPGLSQEGLGNILLGIGQAMSVQSGADGNDQRVADAKANIESSAPAGSGDAMNQVFGSLVLEEDSSAGAETGTLGQAASAAKMSNFEKAVLVGIPVAGMAAVALLSR